MKKKVRIPVHEALMMIGTYARKKILAQVRSVAFIILYLVFFQSAILRVPLANALETSAGIGMVILGLSFFLEGLILGLMPLGERVGVKLPSKTGIFMIAIFGLILGFGATFAEPAISALKTAGSGITAWDSPLLYLTLEKYANWLVLSVGIGVGMAVALGMFRFYYNWSIKPFIYIIIPLILGMSVYAYYQVNLGQLIGLAWDCGAVTTGAVTVPLVLALGIGVSRASGESTGTSGGFGVIMLASAFPILAVLTLGLVLNSRTPIPVSEEQFFSISNRENAMKLFPDENALVRHAFTHGGQEARLAVLGSTEKLHEALKSIAQDVDKRAALLGPVELQDWINQRASESEINFILQFELQEQNKREKLIPRILKQETAGGIRAVIPLSLLLLLVLVFMLREKIRYKDEVAVGIFFTLAGMILLTSGIRLGLASLGAEVGSQLPRAFATEEKVVDRIVIPQFDSTLLYSAITQEGEKVSFFNLNDGRNLHRIEFNPEKLNTENRSYEYELIRKPLFGENLKILGLILVLIFAFGMGYGATLAEPALNALGMTVENLTAGTIRQNRIVQVVSVGVGIGITLGLARILFDLPLIWLIVPPYLLLILISFISDEEFTAIAWDSGGVTTGPVTVPLVLAMGLSIGGALDISDGFGILALASAFPILTTLLYGLYAQARQKRSISENNLSE